MIKTETYSNGTVCLRPIGDLDWSNAAAFRRAVHNALTPFMSAEIDLGGVESADAVGIGVLLASVRLIRTVVGEVRVSRVPPLVQSRLDLLGIDLAIVGAVRAEAA